MKFTRMAVIGAALMAMAGSAFAQSFNTATAVFPITQRTYEATIVGLVPAASATDLLTITGVAGHIVRVTRAECTGTATAVGAANLVALVRSTANTGGTSTTPAAIPADPSDAAAGATVKAYTANPTVGTSVGPVRAAVLVLTPTSSTTIAEDPVNWTFGNNAGTRAGIVLRSASQVFSLNGNGASFPAGTALNCSIEWTEL
ncbi:MAG TPA: hypothetical protein VMU57_12655 [Edaphobacter sp.]|uniref:hypothetical protein n=1 Tax=Edaphobacter sp. TaxID=1934404 RepID=UPI002BF9ECE4|nr:hypothetical protein [Edaphobacter sp.]HUZ95751.1 hypothetical protein [Edaphobacter sp.]